MFTEKDLYLYAFGVEDIDPEKDLADEDTDKEDEDTDDDDDEEEEEVES